MDKKSISIIIPTFNSNVKHFKTCIEKIIEQLDIDKEIIIVDDGSTDENLLNFLEELKENENIKIIKHDKNKGVSAARNTALNNASKDFVCFVDSDDYIYNNKTLKRIVNTMVNNDCDIGVFSYRELISNGSYKNLIFNIPRFKKIIFREKDDIAIRHIQSSACNKVFKKELIDKYNLRFWEEISFGEDLIFNYVYFTLSNGFVYIPDLFYVRRAPEYDKYKDRWEVIKEIYPKINEYIKSTYPDLYKESLYNKIYKDLDMAISFYTNKYKQKEEETNDGNEK